MSRRRSMLYLTALSFGYAAALALLGYLDSPALVPVAVPGVFLVGGLWVLHGVRHEVRKDSNE